jgi:hypothetical protein
MRAPTAIRDDRNPFWFGIWRYIRWTSYRCPYCGARFRTAYVPRKVSLGQGDRTCSGCGKVFDDGSREWPELTTSERTRYLLPVPIVGILAGYALCAAIPFLRRPLNPGELIFVAFMTLFLLAFMVPWLCWRFLSISKSRARYVFHKVVKD